MAVSNIANAPEAVIDRFAELISAGDVEGALALYEEDAVIVPEPGRLEREETRFARRSPRSLNYVRG